MARLAIKVPRGGVSDHVVQRRAHPGNLVKRAFIANSLNSLQRQPSITS
jgi:hypothetical protein